MKVGDLVQLGSCGWQNFGLVVGIISESLVEVLWTGTEYVYMESIANLEVVNESR